ncbi:MAG: hypothetical protein WBZ36_16105, partial [Candidatus Nitrosopolaris sp.]
SQHQYLKSGYLSKILMADRKCEICGALNKPLSSFIYDSEYSYDDYYKTDSVKICPFSSKFECVDCHKRHSNHAEKD